MSRRTAVGSMALATASLVIERSVVAAGVERPRGIASKGSTGETLEEFFWQNAVLEEFSVIDYVWFESSERPPKASLVLESVTRYEYHSNEDARPRNVRRFAISLLFKAERKVELQPACYRMSNPNFGEFDLLLNKTKLKSGEIYYEAVLN